MVNRGDTLFSCLFLASLVFTLGFVSQAKCFHAVDISPWHEEAKFRSDAEMEERTKREVMKI